jgi:hypothetical protein
MYDAVVLGYSLWRIIISPKLLIRQLGQILDFPHPDRLRLPPLNEGKVWGWFIFNFSLLILHSPLKMSPPRQTASATPQ